MSAAKATSVLRDDLGELVRSLGALYGEKKGRLDRLFLSESDKRHYLLTQDIDRIEAILEQEASLMGEIDVIDFDIARTEANITAVTGIRAEGLYDFLSDTGDAKASAIVRQRVDVKKAVEELRDMKEESAEMIRASLATMKKSIDELRLIRKLKAL